LESKKRQQPHAIEQLARGGKLWSENQERDALPITATGQAPLPMHGGAPGSGAPKGERNGNYRHGRRTAEAIAERRELMNFIREARRFARQALD
jgi:hypothetical protein